jgi:hypothetical protein
MPTLVFPYQMFGRRLEMLPLVTVNLLGPRPGVFVPAVVDSGAVRPIFPKKAAEDAGLVLPPEPNDRIQYGGGTTASFLIRAWMMLGSQRLDTEISFVEKLELPYALLGRYGVFSNFNTVTFVERAETPRVEFTW